MPATVFTDDGLVALINAVAARRRIPFGGQAVRGSNGGGGSPPPVTVAAAPGECQAFVGRLPWDLAADTSASAAQGVFPIAEGGGGPTTSVMFTVRSAARDVLAQSDFNYDEELKARCTQFDMVQTEPTGTMTTTVKLIDAPPMGERSFAALQGSKPPDPPGIWGSRLSVLAGTLSISLSLGVSTEADAQSALGSMAGIAHELIDEALTAQQTSR